MIFLKRVAITKQTILFFFLFITIPAIYFFPFSFSTLTLSLILGLLLKIFLNKESNRLCVCLFALILILAITVSGHKIYSNIAIDNVTNSQRGEHPNYQTKISAKLLHNKSTSVMYYLQNLNDRLSISTIFASGSYPNISKYLPLAFIFPWYIIGFLISINRRYKEYLNYVFITALSTLLVLASIFSIESAQIFIFAVIWFIGLVSVEQIVKLPKKYAYSVFVLNLIYLGIFFLSYKAFLI